MRVLKKINNNAVLAVDDDGRQMVALGRGLGFLALGDTVELARVRRTFYDVDPQSVALVNDLDPDVLAFSSQLVDTVRDALPYALSGNFAFILADHVAFALSRARQGIVIRMPLAYDIAQQYPLEYRIGENVCAQLERLFNVRLPKSEATGIALCFVNNMVAPDGAGASARHPSAPYPNHAEKSATGREAPSSSAPPVPPAARTAATSPAARPMPATPPAAAPPAIPYADEDLPERCVECVEHDMGVSVDRSSFNYSRFATHLQYLCDRLRAGNAFEGDGGPLVKTMRAEAPQIARTTDKLADLLEKELGGRVSEEERLWLMLHVNRMFEKARASRSAPTASAQREPGG